MKLTSAWEELGNQNLTLKVAVLALSIIVVVLCVSLIQLATQPQLLFERSCETTFVEGANSTPTEAETRVFLEKVLKLRFESGASDTALIGESERRSRDKEQKEFAEKKVIQRILVSEIQFNESSIIAKVDRVVSIENIKSVFPIELSIRISNTRRTPENPYGLLLENVEEVEPNAK